MYDTRYRYHVPDIYSKQKFAAGSPIVLLYEKGDAVRIEPRPLLIRTYADLTFLLTFRLYAHSSRKLFRPQTNGDGTRMHGVLGEFRASCRH